MRDVLVIGGGSADSIAAALLAQQGLSVTLLERERFPRFQIGASLLSYNNDTASNSPFSFHSSYCRSGAA